MVLLVAYGGNIALFATSAISRPRVGLDPLFGWLVLALQAIPCLAAAALVVIDVATSGRHRLTRIVAEIAIVVAAWIVLSLGVLVAVLSWSVALPVLAVGGGLIASLVISRWPRRRTA
ncbi:MAG TPA: hypothetical protein VGK63_04680 [Candidatus Limnocylindrales bacterium]